MKAQFFRLVLLSTLLVSIDKLFSQTFNMQSIPDESYRFGFTLDKPFYGRDYDESLLNGIYELQFNVPLSLKFNLIGNIPFINSNYDRELYFWKLKKEETGFGNIFIGLQTKPDILKNNRSIISFGLYLPTAERDVAFDGIFVNYYNPEQFIPDLFGLYFNYAYYRNYNSGISYGLEVGPNVLISTQDKGGNELLMHYGLNTSYQIDKFLISFEYLGNMIVSANAENFTDRLIHQLNFGAMWRAGIVSPKVYYRFYLREALNEFVDGVLGVGVDFSIN